MVVKYINPETGIISLYIVRKVDCLPNKDGVIDAMRLYIIDEKLDFIEIQLKDESLSDVLNMLLVSYVCDISGMQCVTHKRHTDTDKELMREWYESRIPFTISADGIKYAMGSSQFKSSLDWLMEDLNYPWATAEFAIRGHLTRSSVVFYIGKDFHSIDMSFVSDKDLKELVSTCCRLYGVDKVCIENGRVRGPEGTRWQAQEVLYTMARLDCENN